MKTAAILTAGGKGTRLNTNVPKQFLEINGKPLLYFTIEKFQRCSSIDDIVLVVPDGHLNPDLQSSINDRVFPKLKKIVPGGKERYHSVFNGLNALEPDVNFVAIHDGVRPFIEPELIDQAVSMCKDWHAVIVAVPVKQTIKEAEADVVVRTLERIKLWEAQTPQIFDRELIFNAYQCWMENVGNLEITDDAMLVELSGHPVRIIEGSYSNLKITTPGDFEWAKYTLEGKRL
ncbi:2-C-methyl-D-erythritol 4-phosphate cytidylyltransferase [candidate division KSB1 bacterium]|nr:2-C-methyl-D-erythritol 4-phosphate cytidylyltransferase [candidate division KSB1 bacterium]